jgi:hypothetical protein
MEAGKVFAKMRLPVIQMTRATINKAENKILIFYHISLLLVFAGWILNWRDIDSSSAGTTTAKASASLLTSQLISARANIGCYDYILDTIYNG